MKTVLAAVIVSLAAPAFAGITLTWDKVKGGETTELTMQCEGKKAHFTAVSKRFDGMIWDGETETMLLLKNDDKSYRRINMKDMQAQLAAGREKMAAALAKMSPEQRAKMEAMMAGKMGSPAAAARPREPAKFTPTGKKEKIGSWNCEWHDVTVLGQSYQACVAPWSGPKMTKDDLSCFASMADSVASMTHNSGQASQEQESAVLDYKSWPGFVVATVRTIGDGTHKMTLKHFSKGPVPDAAFKVPEGFKEVPAAHPR